MVRFNIVLVGDDQVEQIYRPGSVVEGYVVLELSSSQNIKGVSIVISGKARVKWTTAISPSNYSDTETVLRDTSSQLLGNGRNSQQLAAGRHELPFSFRLPPGLPSSYYNKKGSLYKGYIRYSLTATTLRPWKSNLHASRVIQVKDIVNTNTLELSFPLSGQRKRDSSFCCGSGPITMSVQTDRGGYCPGESIAFTIRVENNGNRRITSVIATLTRSVIYFAQRRALHKYQSVEIIRGRGAGPRDETNWNCGMLIPETIPTISNCRVIRLSYTLNVQILVAFAKNLTVKLPIFIGTEPFQREQPTLTTANAYRPSSTNPEFGSVQIQQPDTNAFQHSTIPRPPPNPRSRSFPRQQPTVATNNYQTPNINVEGAHPPLNTGGDQEMRETAFAPVSDLVTNYTSDQPPSYDSIFNK